MARGSGYDIENGMRHAVPPCKWVWLRPAALLLHQTMGCNGDVDRVKHSGRGEAITASSEVCEDIPWDIGGRRVSDVV